MAESTTQPDGPGSLVTNTYILQDFAEIVWMVCITTNSSDSVEHRKSRLKVTESQFRQTSTAVALDENSLELFTFYRKADFVKDQAAIYRKYVQICQANSCKATSRNTCHLAEFLQPERKRLRDLFSRAILASISVSSIDGGKAYNVKDQLWLTSVTVGRPHDALASPGHQVQWHLQQLDLKILGNGCVLLVTRSSRWPLLVAAVDKIDPYVEPMAVAATLLLIPGGHLARYKGHWHTNSLPNRVSPSVTAPETLYRDQWCRLMERALNKFTTSDLSQPGTIWLELEVPLLSMSADSEQTDSASAGIQWKTIYWPAALSFMFTEQKDASSGNASSLGNLSLTEQWFAAGAIRTQAPDSKTGLPTHDANLELGNDFFDDEPQFGSPQIYMNTAANNFASLHGVYPTPPDVMNTQPTPGFSVDGSIRTPAPPVTSIPAEQSSPASAMNMATVQDSNQSAIANFLRHDADEEGSELFGQEDADFDQDPGGEEPDWDFFDPDDLDPNASTDMPEGAREETRTEQVKSSDNSRQQNSPKSQRQSIDTIMQGDEEQNHESQPLSDSHVRPGSPCNPPQFPTIEESASNNGLPVTTNINDTDQNGRSGTSDENKRRRSSAYELPPRLEEGRDQKYSRNGKYWFDMKGIQQNNGFNQLPSMIRRISVSDSSAEDGTESSGLIEDIEDTAQLRMWTRYEPPAAERESAPIAQGSLPTSSNHEVESLVSLMLKNAEHNFFQSDPLARKHSLFRAETGDLSSSTLNTMINQLTQSSILKDQSDFGLPSQPAVPRTELSFTLGSISTRLAQATIDDLVEFSSPSQGASAESRVTQMKADRLKVCQADSKIVADLLITDFWQTLNLQPLSGSKDLLCLCICPADETLRQGATLMLQRMSETWSSCNMGLHRIANLKNVSTAGIVPWEEIEDKAPLLRRVAKCLVNMDSQDSCTIVYMVVPDDDVARMPVFCEFFLELQDALQQKDYFESSDLVLQVVPSAFVAGDELVACKPEAEFISLALELYHKVPSPSDTSEAGVLAPAIALEQSVQGRLAFINSSDHNSPFQPWGVCCHLAYCISDDQNWISAAWCDEVGTTELTMSYSLKPSPDGQPRPINEVVQHLCKMSVELMQRQKKRWWLAVAKINYWSEQETRQWQSAAQKICGESGTPSQVALLGINLQPPITTHAPKPKQSQTQQAAGSNLLHTPVSTPQAFNTTSPEQASVGTPSIINNPSTPPEGPVEIEDDTETFLIQKHDTMWSVTFSFDLEQLGSTSVGQQAVASGLLLKREDNEKTNNKSAALLGVNLTAVIRTTLKATEVEEKSHVLEEVLQQYKGLHNLAVARRVIDPHGNVVPWHIATAFKGARLLEVLA